jgi:hypothetical protein
MVLDRITLPQLDASRSPFCSGEELAFGFFWQEGDVFCRGGFVVRRAELRLEPAVED